MDLFLWAAGENQGVILAVLAVVGGGLAWIGVPVWLVELWQLQRRHALDGQRVRGMLTSVFCALPVTVVEVLGTGGLLAVYTGVAALSPWSLPVTWGAAVVCLVAVDFFYYWEHRIAHEVSLLWGLYHSVHHSADHFDQTIGLRISFVDFFVTPLFYLPLVAVGFHPVLVLVCFGIVLGYQQWIHTELVGRLPLLDPWLNTPSNHRVHHARNPLYLDRNYGGILILWDRLFGTYQGEEETVDYGLVEPLRSRHPVAVHFHGLGKVMTAAWSAPTIRAFWRTLFGKPGRCTKTRSAVTRNPVEPFT